MTPPQELVVISGKGGTGKTSVVAAFAALAGGAVLADCDVDAADLHLVLDPQIGPEHPFSGRRQAIIDSDACTACGRCAEVCRFAAVLGAPDPGYSHRPHRLRRLRALPPGLPGRRHPHGAGRERRLDDLRDALRAARARAPRRRGGQLRQTRDTRARRGAQGGGGARAAPRHRRWLARHRLPRDLIARRRRPRARGDGADRLRPPRPRPRAAGGAPVPACASPSASTRRTSTPCSPRRSPPKPRRTAPSS